MGKVESWLLVGNGGSRLLTGWLRPLMFLRCERQLAGRLAIPPTPAGLLLDGRFGIGGNRLRGWLGLS